MALNYCREVTRQHAKSFYFSAFPLPEWRKQAAFTTYAFCRWVDDTIDEAEDPAQVTKADMLSALNAALDEADDSLPFAPALRAMNHEFKIPRRFFGDLIEGCCRDRQPARFQTFTELEEYCYYVASVVGLMMSKIFGLQDPLGVPQAAEMGVAMQLTNILRDVAEDQRMGRIYLAEDELRQFGLDHSFIEKPEPAAPEWNRFMRFQIDRARAYYISAEAGINLLDRGGARHATRVMSRVYGGILGEIERAGYDVFSGRVFVPLNRKIWLTATSWQAPAS